MSEDLQPSACCHTPGDRTQGSTQGSARGAGNGSEEPGYHGDKAAYLRRLKRIEGQVRGLHRMVEEDTYCIDVLTQVAAATKALEGLSLALVEDHVRHCVRDAAESGKPDTIDKKLDEVLGAIKRLM